MSLALQVARKTNETVLCTRRGAGNREPHRGVGREEAEQAQREVERRGDGRLQWRSTRGRSLLFRDRARARQVSSRTSEEEQRVPSSGTGEEALRCWALATTRDCH